MHCTLYLTIISYYCQRGKGICQIEYMIYTYTHGYLPVDGKRQFTTVHHWSSPGGTGMTLQNERMWSRNYNSFFGGEFLRLRELHWDTHTFFMSRM